MAIKSRTRSTAWKAVHFLIRFLGLNGLVAVAIGLVLWHGLGYERAGLIVAIAGAVAVVVALLGEVRGVAESVVSHRGAAGINVLLQVALASVLVIGGNVYSFSHFKRYDCTRDKLFTLDEKISERLATLRGETDIIVYVQHVSFGQRVDLRQDDYDQAAEKIISDRVIDLVEQFQEAGPRFHIHILDTQKKNYKDREKALKAISEDLVGTIKKTPEDSIFFYARDTKNIQRLSFNDIYHLDKKASAEANDGKGNLVLIDCGVQNFAGKILKIEEKKPRVGFAVVHPLLGQDGREDIGMPGLKIALPARDFEGRDIVLWKRLQDEPAALEHEESRYEMLEAKKTNYDRILKERDEELKEARDDKKYWETSSIEEINKRYVLVQSFQGWAQITRKELEEFRKAQGRIPPTAKITEDYKTKEIAEWVEIIDALESEMTLKKERLEKTIVEKGRLRVDNLEEQRRIANVRDKFNRLLADIDMLVLPRATFINLLRREFPRIPSDVYPMHDTHIEAIKDFMKAGKPVMFLLGPMNEPGDEPTIDPAKDSLEKLLTPFNVVLPNQAILFTSEGEAMEENRERMGPPGGNIVDIPPAEFDWKKTAGSRFISGLDFEAASPIRTSLRLTARGLGDKSSEGMKIRHPRPVYVVRTSWSPETVSGAIGAMSIGGFAGPSQALGDFYTKVNKKFDEKSVFLMTDTDCWNEERPIPTPKYAPRYKRPKNDDPDKGTVQEKRRGPFPIGVALEADVPREWYDSDATQMQQKVRIAVIGHGGVFVGDKLSPLREKLFLDVSNWLLGRENLLSQESATWQYPRVKLDSATKSLWEWGARLGLPLLFVYLGMIVWLLRRMR
jgi:hypothetical protein